MGKSGVLEHKSGNISETRTDRGKVTIGAYIGTYQRSFQRHHPRPSRASPSPRLGFAPHPKLHRYYLRNGKSYGFQIWPVYSKGPSEQNPIKNFGQRGAWAYPARDCPIFSGTPYNLRHGKSYGFQIWPVHSEGPSEQKRI